MRRESGYTIIEVMLFVAISGLLILGVLAGFRGSIQSNRLTDTTRSFESNLEAQYSTVRTGSVVRPINEGDTVRCDTPQQTFPGASDFCLVIGKLLKLERGADSKVSTYNIVANVKPSDACYTPANVSGVDVIKRYCPRILEMGSSVGEFTPQWAAEIDKAGFMNQGGTLYQSADFIAFIRDPGSELVYVVPFTETGVPTLGPFSMTGKIDATYTNTRGSICLKHDTAPTVTSYVLFTGGEGVGSIESATDDSVIEEELRC